MIFIWWVAGCTFTHDFLSGRAANYISSFDFLSDVVVTFNFLFYVVDGY
jgi:hypothetical protein